MIEGAGLFPQELSEQLALPAYRGRQLFSWIQKGAALSEMTDLSKDLREKLSTTLSVSSAEILQTFTAKDRTKKFLIKLTDGTLVESVLMTYSYGKTVCLSTQAGCKMGCVFCASGADGFCRNLTAGEILSQFLEINKIEGTGRNITNVVLMGSGEPLDNYEQTVRFIELISHPEGQNISRRNISLSTCGLADKIVELADSGLNVTLAISLHATLDEKRKAIMPVANRYTVAEIAGAARYYFQKTKRRVIFEYALTRDNTREADADRLKKLLAGMSAHINLIMLNKTDTKSPEALTHPEAEAFQKALESRNLSATIRRSLGSEIEGACGQLRAKYVENCRPD